ncbi:transmembrane protein 202 isoform X5 [Vulpes vulpes]|uniref:Transmembrane protein 202 isoform X5 n=1 Tax=Vulpes vulpes TaxID=9627 RepID=A0A3Q7TAM1_VULVU|nr:transmembrane protein 202 isoform X5 [Vulpes vulpes]
MVAFSTLAGSRLRWGPGTFAVGPVGTGRARGLTAWDGFMSREKWSKKGSRGRMLHAELGLADWFLSLRRLTWSLPPGVGARAGIPSRLLAILNSNHKLLSPEDIRLAFLFAIRELCFIHLYTSGPNTKPDTATADKPTLPVNQQPSDSMPPQRQQQHVDQIHIYIRMFCGSLCGFGFLMLACTSSLNWVQFLVIKNGLELYAGLWITCNHELCWSHTPKSPCTCLFLCLILFLMQVKLYSKNILEPHFLLVYRLNWWGSIFYMIAGFLSGLNHISSRVTPPDQNLLVIPLRRTRIGNIGSVQLGLTETNEGVSTWMNQAPKRQSGSVVQPRVHITGTQAEVGTQTEPVTQMSVTQKVLETQTEPEVQSESKTQMEPEIGNESVIRDGLTTPRFNTEIESIDTVELRLEAEIIGSVTGDKLSNSLEVNENND